MSYPVKEDPRTLKGFYPDAEMRHQVHRTFAHRFLPLYVHRSPWVFAFEIYDRLVTGRPVDPSRYIQTRWMLFEESTGLVAPDSNPEKNGILFRKVTDLTMTFQQVQGMPTMIVRMPHPERMPEAYYLAIVLLTQASNPRAWPQDLKARVFTLEHSDLLGPDGLAYGVLCEWTPEGKHLNFRSVVRADRDPFVQSVAKLLENPDPAPGASFTPGKDGAPSEIQIHPTDPKPPTS